jgi:hypothetical protein
MNSRGPGRDVEHDKLQLHMGTVRLFLMHKNFDAAKSIKLLDAAIVTEITHIALALSCSSHPRDGKD